MKKPSGQEPINNQLLINCLTILGDRLKYLDCKWAYIGSANQYIQGVNVIPRDIDIISQYSCLLKIQENLKEFINHEVTFRTSGNIRSFYGEVQINGFSIELMASVENRFPQSPTLWTPHPNWKNDIKQIKTPWGEFPCISLEYEKLIYEMLELPERVSTLQKIIDNK